MKKIHPATVPFVFLLSIAMLGGPVLAQEGHSLLLGKPETLNPAVRALAAHSARIDDTVIRSGAETISIPLPNGKTITATRVNFERRKGGNYTWRGTTDPISGRIDITLTLEKGHLVGSIDIEAGSYRIEPVKGQKDQSSIEMLDPQWLSNRLANDAIPAPADPSFRPGTQTTSDLASDEIHIMTLYTQDAESGAGDESAMLAAIQAAIDESNTSFINSNMDARFVLVHAGQTSYAESGDGGTDLVWLRTDSGVAALRDQHGADLVGMITETGACGLGYLLTSTGGSPSYAHQVTLRDCMGGKTFTHEHGHNMGMAHNPENVDVSGIFAHSHGHWVNDEFRTIMSYSNPCAQGCTRVTQFSDPTISFQGTPTGVVDERNNAESGRTTASIVADYRAAANANSVNIAVSSSADDAEELSSIVTDRGFAVGHVNLTSSDLEMSEDVSWHGGPQLIGLRFQSVGVPAGANITQAYLTFTADETDSAATSLDIHAQDADDAAAFLTSDNDISNRPLTSATTNWSPPAWNSVGEAHDSPDLSAVVQEVVDRPGWTPGNDMAFIILGSGARVADSYDGSAVTAPRLYVEYDFGPTVGDPPMASYTWDCPSLTCNFTDTSTDSDGSIDSWSWTFGDGGSSSAQHPSHTFSAAGNYTVTLTVTDNDNDQDVSSQTVGAGPIQITRGPYLQTLTDDSVIVRWRSEQVTDSVVRFGTDSGDLSSTASTAGTGTEHAVTVSGLAEHTSYFYSVGNNSGPLAGDDSYHFRTAPLPGTAVPTRFWVIGDSGTANANAQAVRDAYKAYEAASLPSQFMLMLGDNAYNDGLDEEYQAAVFDTYPELLRRLPVWPTLGNHDGHSANSSNQSGPYYDIFNLPVNGEAGGLASFTEAYYSFDYGNVHFVVLDSYETDRSTNGTMMTWLESDLATNDKPWVIAFWHHPPYTKGSHDSDDEGQLIDMREIALPILESWGVDLVMSGHSHSYERSMLIDGHYDDSSTLDVQNMILDVGDGSEFGDGEYEKPDMVAAQNEGAVYAVAGSSGKISGVQGDWPHPIMISYMIELGSMVIDISGNRLDAVFLDDNGAVLDDFAIQKGADVTPPQLSGAQAEDATHVLVDFNEQLDSASAENTGHYAIDGLTVSAASLQPDLRTVLLTVSAMTLNSNYLLTVNNVEDVAGNQIAANSQLNFDYLDAPIVINLQSGITDTYIEEGSVADSNFGSAADLLVDGSTAKHTLIAWDLSSIPSGASILSATIHLEAFNPSPGTFSCKAVLKNWAESEATWNDASNAEAWQTAGATGNTDRDSDVLCNFGPVTNGALSIDLNSSGIAQLQRWVDGADPNYGFILSDPSSSDGADFRSSEFGTASQRPRLEISYQAGSPPPNVAPTAAFTANCTDLDCSFTDGSTDSDGTIEDWAWDFGDGNTSTAQNPSHSYASAGTFTVSLTAIDDDGASHGTSADVTVTDPPGPVTGQGYILSRNLDFSTDDRDFASGDTMYIKVWSEFVDHTDMRKTEWKVNDSDGERIQGTLTNHGDGTFTTAVPMSQFETGAGEVDKLKLEDEDRTKYEVRDIPITISAILNDAPVAGNDAAVVGEDGTVVVNVLANDTDTEGDPLTVSSVTQGANGTVVNNGSNVSYTPDANFSGNDNFTYTVTDGNGSDTATVSVTVTAINDAPVAGFTSSCSDLSCDFTDTSTDIDGTIVTRAWGFGDGNSSTAQNLSHIYAAAGSYTVSLTVTDNNGESDSVNALVTVTGPQPPGPASDPSPADGATDVDANEILGWNAGTQADSHDVYFGTSASPPLVSGAQAGTSYDSGELAELTTYFWRIDERNELGTTTGSVWSFTTRTATPPDTIVIKKAEWKDDRLELKVEAESSGSPDAILTVEGFGQMEYDEGKDKYKLVVKPVESNPGTVTVTSSLGGSASKTVRVR